MDIIEHVQTGIDSLADHLIHMGHTLELQKRILQSVLTEMDDRALDLSMSRRVIITGVGKNSNLAEKASQTYASLGIPSLYVNTSHLAHGDFGFIGPYDMVIHLSRSGTTDEMIAAANHLKTIKPKVVQVLLTCKPCPFFDGKETHKAFDYIIYTGSVVEIDDHQLAPTTSTTVLLALLDLLGTYVSRKVQFGRLDFLQYHPGGALGAMLKAEKQ